MIYAAIPFLLLGLTMYTRGLIYTLKPEGKMAEKRKRRNLKVGFTTDMKVFGRKVRRLGFMLTLAGAGLLAWEYSSKSADTKITTPEPAPPSPPSPSPEPPRVG